MVVTAPILATGWQPSVFDTVDSVAKESSCNAGDGDLDSIPGSGRSPEKGNGNPLQYFCLENPMDRGAWQVTVCGVTELDMTEQRERERVFGAECGKQAIVSRLLNDIRGTQFNNKLRLLVQLLILLLRM